MSPNRAAAQSARQYVCMAVAGLLHPNAPALPNSRGMGYIVRRSHSSLDTPPPTPPLSALFPPDHPIHYLAGRFQDSHSVFWGAQKARQKLRGVRVERTSFWRFPCLILLNDILQRSLMGGNPVSVNREPEQSLRDNQRSGKWWLVREHAVVMVLQRALSVVLKKPKPCSSVSWFLWSPFHLDPNETPPTFSKV